MNNDGIVAIIMGIVWMLVGLWAVFAAKTFMAVMFLVLGGVALYAGGEERGRYRMYWELQEQHRFPIV